MLSAIFLLLTDKFTILKRKKKAFGYVIANSEFKAPKEAYL
jgi:hypothetical protein